MPLPIICDEHIPYAVSDGLVRRGIYAMKVQRIGLRSAGDPAILEQAREARRVIYTNDRDFLRLAAVDVRHPGILYHQANHYSVRTQSNWYMKHAASSPPVRWKTTSISSDPQN